MEKTRFEVKEDHLKLIGKMYVEWNGGEFGAPTIDCKRPYGNGGVIEDIAGILGVSDNKRHEDDEPYFPDAEVSRMEKLHKETETVLQIILTTGLFEVGMYECDKYSINWAKI